METKYIEKLLAAFYNGETSEQEEASLYQYFIDNKKIPRSLQQDRSMFLMLYNKENKTLIPENLEQNLNLLIENLEKQDREKKTESSTFRFANWKWVSGIAAGVAIIISTGIYLQRNIPANDTETAKQDTFSNPRDAYKETEKALLYVSSKLNKGIDQVETLENNIEKVNKVVERNIQL